MCQRGLYVSEASSRVRVGWMEVGLGWRREAPSRVRGGEEWRGGGVCEGRREHQSHTAPGTNGGGHLSARLRALLPITLDTALSDESAHKDLANLPYYRPVGEADTVSGNGLVHKLACSLA